MLEGEEGLIFWPSDRAYFFRRGRLEERMVDQLYRLTEFCTEKLANVINSVCKTNQTCLLAHERNFHKSFGRAPVWAVCNHFEA